MTLTLLGVGGGRQKDAALGDHYLFIDGRYLDLAYRDLISRFLGSSGALDMRRVIDRFSPQRTYYYNAVDDRQKPGEADDAFKARVDAQLDRLDRINSLPNCHVRVGSITGRAVKRRRQKQVDVQLAVDALLHSFNRTASVITLVAGDLDFKPLVDALVTLGVQTRLAFEKTSTSIELRGSADQALEINLQLAWECVFAGVPGCPRAAATS